MDRFTAFVKYAVTGGAGFVGSHIVRLLVSANHDVVVIDNLHTGKMKNLDDVIQDIDFYDVDIRDMSKLENVLKNNVDGIFHQAALTYVPESFTMPDEYYDVNVRGTENIFRAAKNHDIKVVYASSSSVYGDSKQVPIVETHHRNPINPYGLTKLQGEILASKYHNDGVRIIGLRYFNIFGRGQTSSYAGVVTKFLKKISAKQDLVIFGDGTQVRDFIYVTDAARANLAAMQNSIESGFFNIGTGVPTLIKELADTIMELSCQKVGVVYEKALEGDVKASLADTTKTEKILNCKYEISLRDGLRLLLLEKC